MTALLGGADPLPILMFHAVPATPGDCRTPLDIPRAEFAAHLDTLSAQGFRVCGLSAAIASRSTTNGVPVVALTIDDAYADVEGAVSELAARGMSGTVYVPTDFPDRPGAAAGGQVFAHPVLSWSALADLAADGVELGSHAVSHRPLDTLPTAVVRRELVGSRRRLADRTGVTAAGLCYPYGYTSRRVEREASRAGYRNACTVGRRVAGGGDRLLALPRLQPLPGMSAAALTALVRDGEPGWAPSAKRALQPAWRGVRFAAARVGVNWT